MRTLALRLHGANDLRLEHFELPPIRDDEILAEIVSNSICMSDHKAVVQGAAHKRVPPDVAENPVILGHEFCGRLLQVGRRWADRFRPGQVFTVQPALNIPGAEHRAPGYSFPLLGGNATLVVVPREVMERDCLLTCEVDGFFKASLAEPLSCIIGAFKTSYHFRPGTYLHETGPRPGGCMAVLAGAGPMGLGAVDLALHGERRPRLLAVTDIDQARLDRAAAIFTPARAAEAGVELHYVNTAATGDPVAALRALTPGGSGYDDVFVFAPVAALIEQASALLGFNGCLNFFAGPTDPNFTARINFYDVHYMGHHVVGSSGGNTDDLREALALMSAGRVDPSVMVTHVGGIDSAAAATVALPSMPGGKKLVYTHVAMPMTAIADFRRPAACERLFALLADICERHNGLWSSEAERCLLQHAPRLAPDAS
jgi:threonine dehydrogenase-like Zn-dependent dehydrogenase